MHHDEVLLVILVLLLECMNARAANIIVQILIKIRDLIESVNSISIFLNLLSV